MRIPFSKKAAMRGGVVVFAVAAGTAASVHFSAMREYAQFENKVRTSQTDEPTDGYAAYAGTTERIEAALKLAENAPGSRVLISGGHPSYGLDDIMESFETSVDADRITFLSYAQNTKGNAMETRTWARTLNLSSVTIVTNADHAPRAYLETEKVLPDSISMHFHVVGDFPEEGSLERIKQAYKLWCVDTPICESMMRQKKPVRPITPIPKQKPVFADGPDASHG